MITQRAQENGESDVTREVFELPHNQAFSPALKPPTRPRGQLTTTRIRFACLGLAFLPALLAMVCYYIPLTRHGAKAWDLHGDAKFYAYQLTRAHEVGGRWWQIAEDPWVGQPYPSAAAKHPGVYEGLDVLLISSFTGGWLSPEVNFHLIVLAVLSFNGWVAGWMTYRLTGRLFWTAMSMALITVNVSTAFRFQTQLHLIKYGWVLIAVWAMWRYLEEPSPRRGAWLGFTVALVLQSSYYFGFLLGLALSGWWLVNLAAGRLTRRHLAAAVIAGLTAAGAGAIFTLPVWLTSQQALLAEEQYFRRPRVDTWTYGSQLWHFCVAPTWRYSHRFLQAFGAEWWAFLETWHYLGLTVLLALAAYTLGRSRGWRIPLAQPRFLHLLLGLIALLVVLSLSGGPSVFLYDFFPAFRCYGRAGCLVMALTSVAAPVIWHALTTTLGPRRRAAVCLALMTLLGCENYRLARWINQPFDEQHPAWATWLAAEPSDVRAAVFSHNDVGPEAMCHWDALNQRLLHRHATLNGGEFGLINADLRQLGCSLARINSDGLRFVVSLGYETLVFKQDYLHDNPWIEDLPWLDEVTTVGAWRVYRANASTPWFPKITLRELLAREDQLPPMRVPAGAVVTGNLGFSEAAVVDAGSPVRLIWVTAQGYRMGKAEPAFFQHLLGPHWPAYHVQAPARPGDYQLQFIDADDRLLGAKSYRVDAELQTARRGLAERALTVNVLLLNELDRNGPLRLRIENATPYYIESHQFDPNQTKGQSRNHVGLATPGPCEFHLMIQPSGAPNAPAPPPVIVPLPHDLPPFGHIELVISPAPPVDMKQQTKAEVRAVFHQAQTEVVEIGKADIRLERAKLAGPETTQTGNRSHETSDDRPDGRVGAAGGGVNVAASDVLGSVE